MELNKVSKAKNKIKKFKKTNNKMKKIEKIKVGTSSSKKFTFIYFNGSHLKMM